MLLTDVNSFTMLPDGEFITAVNNTFNEATSTYKSNSGLSLLEWKTQEACEYIDDAPNKEY